MRVYQSVAPEIPRAQCQVLSARAGVALSACALCWWGVPAVAQQARTEAESAATLAQAGPAAQVVPAPKAEDPATGNEVLNEVVVTGSRVATTGATAPTPVTVVSSQQLQQAAPSSIVDAINQLPQMANSSTPQSTGVGTTGSVAQSFLNLRSLGANRTLTLFDGARIVPSSLLAETDVSLIPENLIDRVEIVTGGASAVYGSDAVAGVVNFVLNTKFNGLEIQGQGGESTYQDGKNAKIEITAGHSLFDGRGHVEVSAEFYRNNGVKNFLSRPWFDSCALIANPTLSTTYIPACNVQSAEFNYGGMISTGPLKGTYFGPGGVPMQFHYGSELTAGSMVGGTGEGGANGDVGAYFTAVPEVDRRNIFGRMDYDLTEHLTGYVQLLYAEANASYNESIWAWQGLSSGYQIQSDNAYLPSSIRNTMIADGITSFTLNRQDEDFGGLATDTHNRTQEYKAGLKGDWGEWKLDAYLQHGENNFLETTINNPIVNHEYNAADAVLNPATGQIVCRSTLTQPNNGCVPIDLFGEGSPSQQALAYVTGTGLSRIRDQEDVAEASGSGRPFSDWAGPVDIAFGASYRRESADQTVDPISAGVKEDTGGYLGFPEALQGVFGGFDRGNPQPVSGSYNVTEVFAETLVPLAKDFELAKSLDFNGAVRGTHYSTSGDVVSWKTGLTWQVVDDIRVRAARSHDIRAPNVNELFLGKSQGQGSLVDDFQATNSVNRIPVVYTVTSGNTALKPEIADTTTVGIVLAPHFISGLTLSIDSYDIRIKDAITTLSGQNTIDQCFAGAAQLCALLTRDAQGVLTAVSTPYLNIGAENSSGEDFEVDYATHMSSIVSGTKGDLAFRALANHVNHLTEVIPGAPNLLLAGEDSAGGVPHWQGVLSAQYALHPVTIYAQERLIGGGKLNNTYTAAILAPQFNTVGGVAYTDLTLNYDFKASDALWSVYFTVNNLFNRAPPAAPSPYFVFGTSNGGTNLSLYDVIGRQYTLGFKLNL